MSTAVVPNSFLFRFAVRCIRVAKLPSSGDRIVKLNDRCRIPFFGAMDGQPEFAKVWMAWNEGGLGVAFEVRGKEMPIQGEAARPTGSDGMSLWLDMRDSRTAHRAGRFCQRFLINAHDGADSAAALVLRKAVKRASEEPPPIDETQIRVARFPIDDDGDIVVKPSKKIVKSYRMEVFLPATVLHGFDPECNRRLGFFYRVRDRELGDQILSGASELPYWEDPSLWSTLVLA